MEDLVNNRKGMSVSLEDCALLFRHGNLTSFRELSLC